MPAGQRSVREYTYGLIFIKLISLKPPTSFAMAGEHLLRDPLFSRGHVSQEKPRCPSGTLIFPLTTPIRSGEPGSKFKGG